MRSTLTSPTVCLAALLSMLLVGCGTNQAVLDQLEQCNRDYRTLAERLAGRPPAEAAEGDGAAGNPVVLEQAGPDVYARAVETAGFSIMNRTERFIQIDMFGLKVQLFPQPSSAQLFAGFSSSRAMSPIIINEWNRTKRFSRSYIDREGDPILESDIDLEGGVTEKAIVTWIQTFAISLKAFNGMLLEAANQPSL